MPKFEIFDGSDFSDFYTIKSSWVSVLGRPATRQEVSSSAELWAAPPPLNTYEGGRIFCLDLFVKGQFICDVQ